MTDNSLVLNILLRANSSSASGVVRNFAKDLMSIGSSGGAAGLVVGALAAVTAAAIGVGVTSVKMAGDFQQAMLENVAGAGLAKDKMDSVTQSVLNMSSVVGRAPTELAQALYPILSGFSAISEKAGKSSLSLATLKLAFESVAGSTTNGSDVALAGVQVFNSLRLATGNAATNMTRMQAVFDIMNKTVEDGNMKWSAYKNVAGKLATSITGTTITFQEASAAEAALTNQAYSASSAQTSLSMLFQKMDVQTDTLAKKAKGLGIAFDEQKFKSMNLAQQMAYLNQVTGGSNSKLLALFQGNGKVLRTFLALTSGAKGYAATLADLNNSQGATAEKFATVNEGWNQSMAKVKAAIDAVMIAIGLKLLPILTQVTNFIGPLIGNFAAWVSSSDGLGASLGGLSSIFAPVGQMFHDFGQFLQQNTGYFREFTNILKVTGGQAFGILSQALSGLAPKGKGMTDAFKPFFAALSGAMPMIETFVHAIGDGLVGAAKLLAPMLSQVGSIVGGVFAGHMKTASSVTKDLAAWWQSTMLPAIKQAMPGFMSLAKTITGTLVPGLFKLWAIGQSVIDRVLPVMVKMFEAAEPVVVRLYGVIANGLAMAIKYLMPYVLQAAKAIADFASDIAVRVLPIVTNLWKSISQGLNFLQANWKYIWPSLSAILMGIWNVIVGIIKVAWALVSGIIKIGLDLISGNWKQAWTDVLDMFKGVWDGIVTMLKGFVSMAWGMLSGLITGIIGIFQNLYNTLVGRSIVPDMIRGILSWFGKLPGEAMGFIHSLVSQLTGTLGNLGSMALGWGKGLIGGFVSGIQSQMGAVGNAVQSVASKVAGFLGFHSPAKEGPGREANLWGPNLIKMFANDIQSTAPKARAAAERMMRQLASAMQAYPTLISKAHMSGNKAQESSLKQQLALLKTQMNEYKGLIKEMGFAYDQYNPNNPINFTPQRGKKGKKPVGGGYGTLNNPGGSSSTGGVSSSGGYSTSSGGTTIINNFDIHPAIMLRSQTTKEQAQELLMEFEKLLARKQRFASASTNQALGAAA